MDKQEIMNRIESAEKQILGLQDEIQNLKEKLVEADEPPARPEIQEGCEYWYTNVKLVTERTERHFIAEPLDFNAFHTEQEAQRFTRICEVNAMLMHCKHYFDRDGVNDFTDDEKLKFFVTWNHGVHAWTIDYTRWSECPLVYFSTQEAAEKAVAWMNEHVEEGL